jgi:tRNA pseudouridine55 synthase
MIINVFKPKNWSSYDVVENVKSILAKKRGVGPGKKRNRKVKVGHAGTLDPLAEGVLIILTDEDTKKQSEIMSLEKEYLSKIAFGAKSSSYDLEQKLEFTDFADEAVKLEDLEKRLNKLLPKYIGKIDQTVPAYSATKVEGKRLYRVARKKIIPKEELPVKKVEIFDIKVESFRYEEISGYKERLPVLTATVRCGKGTYVRSLAHDLGEDIDIGGVLVGLTRTKVGDYDVKDSVKISELPSVLE